MNHKLEHIAVNHLSSSQELKIPVHRFENGEGPHVYIQSSVHGEEMQGNLVIYNLIEFLKDNSFKGKVTLVPIANPMALDQKLGPLTYGRFNLIDGRNFNRHYLDIIKYAPDLLEKAEDFSKDIGSYKKALKEKISKYRAEKEPYSLSETENLALVLQELALDADIVLDLHTAGVGCNYIYSGAYEIEKAKDLGFPFTLKIPNEFAGALDEACFCPWIELQKKVPGFEVPVEAYTVELGNAQLVSSRHAKHQTHLILDYLKKRGVHNSELEHSSLEQEYSELENYKAYHSPAGGLCEYLVKPGIKFKKGDILAQIFLAPSGEKQLVHANEDGVVIHHSPSSAVRKGMGIFLVLEKLKRF